MIAEALMRRSQGHLPRSQRPEDTIVGVVSKRRIYRESLMAEISKRPGLVALDFLEGGEDTIGRLSRLVVDVLLLDLAPHDIRHLARQIRGGPNGSTMVALSSNDDEGEVVSFAEAGVMGFVPREASLDEMCHTILLARRGELHCTDRVSAGLARRLSAVAQWNGDEYTRAHLTVREAEVVGLIDLGLSNKEIATRLSIALTTVKNHVHNLLEKIGVHRRGEASARLAGRVFSDHQGPPTNSCR